MKRLILAAALSLATTSIAFAEPAFPELNGKLVVDQAHLMTPEQEASLANDLHNFSAQKGPQIAVVTIPTLDGADPVDYGNRLFRHLALGDKKRNDGALLLIAVKEHKSRIEVGYGLEPYLTDAASNIINQQHIIPHFKQGDFAGGILDGVQAIETVVTPDPNEQSHLAPVKQDDSWLWWVLGVIVSGATGALLIGNHLTKKRAAEAKERLRLMRERLDREQAEREASRTRNIRNSAGVAAKHYYPATASTVGGGLAAKQEAERKRRQSEEDDASSRRRREESRSSSSYDSSPSYSSSSDSSSSSSSPSYDFGGGGSSGGGGNTSSW